ncbi:short-chain dehydrogenase [Tsukamurella pseudospumae]|uniref:Short-chain dehydrogenase n=1 Tax=Tsukamurella pseudospumae TaxID=239498 RepID=A0A138A8Y2_9ACTN|nr:short-chain dehydrogenase [Tsukamurella pseudospumae]
MAGKVVLVSGGSRGVGAAVAREAVAGGAIVAFTGRDAAAGEALRDELVGAGAEALFIRADVADPAQATASVEEVVAAYGRIDCLCNAAGLTSRGTLTGTTPELFDEHIAINLRAPFFTMAAAVRDMRSRTAAGTVVNIISMSAHGGQPYLAPYVAAKAGLIGLTKNAAHAHRFDRIRINGLNIGWTETEGEALIQKRFHDAPDDWAERAGRELPAGRLASTQDAARAVVFLLSDRSGVVTGSIIDWDQQVCGAYD